MAEHVVTLDDRGARERVARVEALLEDVEALADPAAHDTAIELVGALLDLYGEGLRRLLAGARTEDELVSHLLLLHGLHPASLEDRVREALAEVRPYLEQHQGDVELLAVEDGVARLRLHGTCHGCPSSTATLRLAIEEAIRKTAPDVERIEAEGAVEPTARAAEGPQSAAAGLLQLEVSDALQCPSELRVVS